MTRSNYLQSGISGIFAVSMIAGAVAPIFTGAPAAAQLRPVVISPVSQSQSGVKTSVPAGTSIAVEYDNTNKIVVAPNETVPLTLKVEKSIVSRYGTTLIPAGSQVVGQLQPATGGSQFVAKNIVINGKSQPIYASSKVVTTTQQIRKGTSIKSIVKGAAVGAAAAAGIAALTGDRAIATEEVLGGTGAGALGGWLLGRRVDKVVVVNPDTDLDLTLASDMGVTVIVRR